MTVMELVRPRLQPPLDPDFRPAVLATRAFQAARREGGTPIVIGLARGAGQFSRYEDAVYRDGHPRAAENLFYIDRLVKFLLWQRGGHTVYIGGPSTLGEYVRRTYAPAGERRFDYQFMGGQVYEKIFRVVICDPEDVPPSRESGQKLGRHLGGSRIGFDLGASDLKVSAVEEGKIIFSEEIVWEPRKHDRPEYYYEKIMTALKTAASKLSHVDAIGGSSAGIYVDNRPMVSSLFRSVPTDRYAEIRNLFLRIQSELQVPLQVINDGDVTALAGSMSIGDNGILGIALGSSEAAGFVDLEGKIPGWLNELAFAPIDFHSDAPVEEWSGDRGCGASYLSQQCVFRLAPKAGLRISPQLTDADKLKFVQENLEAGHEGAIQIWQSMGTYLGYALAQYADFYSIRHVLILGRCTSGRGGELLLERARQVLNSEFPELAGRIQLHLPDETTRRVGQAVAAASLPDLAEFGQEIR